MDNTESKKNNTGTFIGSIIGMLFGRRSKVLSLMEEEQVQSPGKTVIKEFFRRKLTIVGLIGFFSFLILSTILPIFFPLELREFDIGQFNQPPSRNMMSMPRHVRDNLVIFDAGPGYGVALTTDNQLRFWGTVNVNDAPLSTPPRPEGTVVQISAGDMHSLALTSDGRVYSWGNNNRAFDIHNIPSAVQGRLTTVSAGRRFSVGLTDDGRLHMWGNNADLGRISATRFPSDAFGVQVETNWLTAGVRTDDGHLYILLNTSREFRYVPDEIQGRVVDFAMVEHTTAALLDDGTVRVWGFSGDPTMVIPEHIQGRVVNIEAGRDHFTVLLSDGTVESWGDNIHGRTNAPNVDNVVSIVVGADHNYAVLEDGSIRTWGLRGFFFGTDGLGRCVFTRLWHGGRYSLLIGMIAVLFSGVIGLVLGGVSGFYGGKLDMFLMRFQEAVQSIPFLPLAMILQWRFRHVFGPIGGMMFLMSVLGLLMWPPLMRLVRGQILQARETEYVIAAKALGVRQFKIIARHILPNVASAAIVWLTLNLATSMLIEGTLSFLGFGISEPFPTWGNMITGMSSVVLRDHWWRWVFPAVSLVTVAISINLIGDGLREATDPRSQGR